MHGEMYKVHSSKKSKIIIFGGKLSLTLGILECSQIHYIIEKTYHVTIGQNYRIIMVKILELIQVEG